MIFARRSPKRTPREVHLYRFTPQVFLAQLLQVEDVRKVESQIIHSTHAFSSLDCVFNSSRHPQSVNVPRKNQGFIPLDVGDVAINFR